MKRFRLAAVSLCLMALLIAAIWQLAVHVYARRHPMQAWLASSLTRYYPASPAETRHHLALEIARRESASFQVVFHRNTTPAALGVAARASCPTGLEVQIRRVGYVPVQHLSMDTPPAELDGTAHLPGLAPDPLLPETTVRAVAGETHAFWITVRTATQCKPGRYPVAMTLSAPGEHPVTLTAQVTVHRAVLPARRNFGVSHWVYADALCARYRTKIWQERFWRLLPAYLADIAAHGQDIVTVPVFTPALAGSKRPTQLLGVTRQGDTYRFDWALVRRWVRAAKAAGITQFEWPHFFSQWGARKAARIYPGHGEDGQALAFWPAGTPASAPVYRDFLAQFLPEFHRFLVGEGILERSYFHVSDEPSETDLARYRAARTTLRELAPWLKVMEPTSNPSFAQEGLVETPVPNIRFASVFRQAGIPSWVYFCCGERGKYLNRLLDTPLAKIRMSGWLFYRLRAQGFLHWGYNYWFTLTGQVIDPFTCSDAQSWPGIPSGDPFVVYPGANGPIDSIRWEVFAESLQDYALLQAARISTDDAMLAPIKGYQDFPHDPDWIAQRRKALLAKLDAQQQIPSRGRGETSSLARTGTR